MSRRGLTLLIAGIGVVVSAAVAALLPVPYVILSPGPTLNTLLNGGGTSFSLALSGFGSFTGNLSVEITATDGLLNANRWLVFTLT